MRTASEQIGSRGNKSIIFAKLCLVQIMVHGVLPRGFKYPVCTGKILDTGRQIDRIPARILHGITIKFLALAVLSVKSQG